jgi:hypothetical protein
MFFHKNYLTPLPHGNENIEEDRLITFKLTLMKLKNNLLSLILLLLINFLHPVVSIAQHAEVKQKIKQDMEKKYADSQRVKGKSELEKITYENDRRYKDPTNKVQATISYEHKELNKKGEVKKAMVQKMVFGKTGECIVMNEGDKNETWMIYNYADKANYMVNVKDKTAMKMPLINMQKLAESGAKAETEKNVTGNHSSFKATGETQNINGYNCTKYLYIYDDDKKYSTMDMWLTNDISLNLGDNYMFGARLNAYKFPSTSQNREMKGGVLVRSILYDKNGNPVSQRDLKEFKKSADEQYFDMSRFKVTDVMSLL